jgi:hypothetical protein
LDKWTDRKVIVELGRGKLKLSGIRIMHTTSIHSLSRQPMHPSNKSSLLPNHYDIKR